MSRGGRRRLAAALALLGLLVGPAVVSAHAQLVASSPGAGEILAEPPAELRLVFSEPLESQITSLDLTAQDGTKLLTRAGEVDPDDPYALVVADPGLAEGIYTIAWRTLSAADGHTTEGFFTFGIGEIEGGVLPQLGGAGEPHSTTDPIGVVGRWLTYLGLLLALGMAVFHRLVVRQGAMPVELRRILAAGLAVSVVATMVVALAAGLEAGSPLDYLLGSRSGALHLARAAVAAAGAVALVTLPARWTTPAAGLAGFAGIVLLVLAGHASAAPVGGTVGQIAHVAAVATWLGGLGGLLLLVSRPAALVEGAAPALRTVVPRFSAIALVSIGLVGVTGVHAAWVQTGSLLPAGTAYGQALVLKTAFALGAMALGGLNFIDGGRMRPWLDGIRTRMTVEGMLAAVVLVMSAVLATTPPVEEVRGVAIEPIPDAFGTVAPDMEMRLIPGRPGVNRLVVTTSDALASVSGLELAMDRLDTGSTTRLPLVLEGTEGMVGMEGMDHGGMAEVNEDGTIDWFADAVVLPPSSRWDTSVRIMSGTGTELSRQRFAFALSDDGLASGAVRSVLNPGVAIAVILLVGGAIGAGLGLGGMSLPRCEPLASRLALVGGGTVGVLIGLLIGAGQVFA